MGKVNSSTIARWPDLIDGCVKCDKKKTEVSYGSRGLCMRCHRVEYLAGRLQSWSPIARDKEKFSRAASQYTKDNYWRRKKAESIYTIVTSIGTAEASERLEVSAKEIAKWMNGDPIPEGVEDRVHDLYTTIKRLTREARSNEREETFFKDVDLGVRFLDGKIF